MHEFAVVESIVKAVLEEAGKHEKVIRIEEVYLEVGDLAFLNSAQLIFAFDALKKNTLLAKAQLLIANMVANVRCKECGYTGPMDPPDDEYHYASPIIMCPKCNGAVDILNGRQCTVRNVRLIVDDEDDGKKEES